MYRKFMGPVAGSVLLLIATFGPATADNFLFSFTNETGNTPGTVTGEIFGLVNNSISPATDVTIISAPPAIVPPSLPFDMFPPSSTIRNLFNEQDGTITAVDLHIIQYPFSLQFATSPLPPPYHFCSIYRRISHSSTIRPPRCSRPITLIYPCSYTRPDCGRWTTGSCIRGRWFSCLVAQEADGCRCSRSRRTKTANLI